MGQKKVFDNKKFWVKKKLGQKFFGANKNFGRQIILVKIFFVQKISFFGSERILGQKNFQINKIFGSKKF